MRITSKPGTTASLDPDVGLDNLGTSLDDSLVQIVTDFAEGCAKQHILVTGGFGTGKSRAVGVSAVAAAVGGARVARLEHGPIGISSFDDFMAAVNDAASGSEVRPAPGSGAASMSGSDGDSPLVIVAEGLDQLVRQMRAADRPALVALLTDENGPLVIGTAILGMLPEDFLQHFALFETAPVASPKDGVTIAIERASKRAVLPFSASEGLLRESRNVEDALLGSQAFWALVGDNLAASVQNPLSRADSELRSLMKAHFGGLLLRIAPSEQRVLLEIARAGAPRTVQEIAEAIDVRNQAAASALARLHADGWVVNIPAPARTDQRRSWYEIADPLLRLHLRPKGSGSVSDLIRSLVEVWQSVEVPSASLPHGDDLDRLSAEATERGESGEPEVARAWFQAALLQHAEEEGLRAKETLGMYWALAVWVGNSGERHRAQRMFAAAIQDLEALFGADSREAIEGRSHAAWNLLELGAYSEAQRYYAEVQQLAFQSGQSDLAALAMQGLGRALGEQGHPDQAVENLALAVELLQGTAQTGQDEQGDEWFTRVANARRGLAYWLARCGDLGQALATLHELLDDSRLGERDRQRTNFDRLSIVALMDRAKAVEEYVHLATTLDASGTDPEFARSARLAAFELAVDEWPGDPTKWPPQAVDGAPLETTVVKLLAEGTLDLQGIAKVLVQVSGAQARALAARLVGAPIALPMGLRAALARTAVPHLQRVAEQRLFSDLASALEGDPAGRANLPKEWSQLVSGMEGLDLTGADR